MISQSLLPEFDQEMANTRKTLERLPDDRFGWKPHEKSGSLGWLAGHIATLPGWAAVVLQQDSFDYAPAGGSEYKMPELPNRQAILAELDKNAAAARNLIEAATDQQMTAPWSLLKGGEHVFTMPRAAVLRSVVMNHLIHHRGQLTVYLRLTGVPVPALYGPSADEMS